MSIRDHWPREKKWKQLYTRSVKLARAKQLGFDYPIVSESQLITRETGDRVQRQNILFVCSRNQWRSPTAETVWRSHPLLSVRSAGTSPNARRKVSVEDIRWAQVIIVMEQKHKSRLKAEFGRLLERKPLHVLEVPDNYRYMDPELVQLLRESVGALLGVGA